MDLSSAFPDRRLFLIAIVAGWLCVVVSPAAGIAQDRPDGVASGQAVQQFPAPTAPQELIAEPALIDKGIELFVKTFGDGTGEPKNGFYPELSNMVTGSGWLSIGPGYYHRLFNDTAIIDVSGAWSWHAYKMMQGRFELPRLASNHLTIGTQVMWQDMTQINYFGLGENAPESDRSLYRMKTTDTVGYATMQANDWLKIGGEVGYLARPVLSSATGWFHGSYPNALDMFLDEPAVTMQTQPNYIHSELSVTADTRDYRSHPTSGGVLRATWSTYSDRDTTHYSFQQYEVEGAQFVPLLDNRWVLAFHGWGAFSDTTGSNEVPFYFMPSLGGHNSLRSYLDYRFHDKNMVVMNAESRWGLWRHLDAAVFLDAGNVFPRLADLNFDKTSVGVGLRMHTERATFARMDIAHGAEGWRFVFRTNDPLHLARFSRHTIAAPFVQ